MGSVRRMLVVTLFALAALTAMGALAWACTPQAYIDLSAASGRAGDAVTVTGRGFVAGPVEIRWNATRGPLLATATGPDFSVDVKIPATAPGIYYPHAVARSAGSADGVVVGDAQRAFEVQGNANSAPRAPGTSPAPRSAPDSATRPAAGEGARGRAESRARGEATPSRPAGKAPASGARTGGQASPRRSLDGSLAARSRRDSATRQAEPKSTRDAAQALPPSPSELTATSDPWSGVGSGRTPTLLPSGADPKASDPAVSGQLAVGLALLGIGLTALVATAASLRLRTRGARADGGRAGE